jgi:hypothetical protein
MKVDLPAPLGPGEAVAPAAAEADDHVLEESLGAVALRDALNLDRRRHDGAELAEPRRGCSRVGRPVVRVSRARSAGAPRLRRAGSSLRVSWWPPDGAGLPCSVGWGPSPAARGELAARVVVAARRCGSPVLGRLGTPRLRRVGSSPRAPQSPAARVTARARAKPTGLDAPPARPSRPPRGSPATAGLRGGDDEPPGRLGYMVTTVQKLPGGLEGVGVTRSGLPGAPIGVEATGPRLTEARSRCAPSGRGLTEASGRS